MIRHTLCIALSCLLFACGGGSSDPISPPVTVVNPVPPPVVSQDLRFTDVAIARGLAFSSGFSPDFIVDPAFYAGGAASGDIDNDGDIDLFILRGDTNPNLLFFNNGNSFTENTPASLAFPNSGTANYKLSGPTFADMDGDKDLDLFIGGVAGDPSFIFMNDGSGVFTNVTSGSGIENMTSLNTISAAFADYDKDGDLDMAMAHWGTPRDSTNPGDTETLWQNDSDASGIKFTPVSISSGIANQLALNLSGVKGENHDYTFAPNFSDINDDTFPDLLSVGDFKGSQVFLNNQDGTFSDVTDTTQITDSNGMGTAVGDFDNDGDNDWFVSSINGNRLYQNNPESDSTEFTNVSETAGIQQGSWGWGSCFADFDADGFLDIYQTNGWQDNSNNPNPTPYDEDESRLWMSNQDGSFSDQAQLTGIIDNLQGRGVVCADFDNDRDVDVLLLLSNSDQAALLWNNDIIEKNTISIFLQGPSPNTQAIGARIYVSTGSVTQMREIAIGSNFTSHNPTKQIFGLGEASTIDELKIVWPDGTEIMQTNVTGNQDLVFTHPNF